MSRKLFGTDGVRGTANTYPMTAEMALRKLLEIQPDPELEVERVEKLYDSIKAAKGNRLKNILITNDEPLVSSDFNHNPASSIFDLTQTQVIEGRLCRVLSWYDNEWGFSNRMLDTAAAMAKLK